MELIQGRCVPFSHIPITKKRERQQILLTNIVLLSDTHVSWIPVNMHFHDPLPAHSAILKRHLPID